MDKIKKFLHGVKKEISRVRWPNRKYMFKYSIAVIVCGVFFSLFFYLTSLLVAYVKVLLS